ncbi:MAG TPA: radical SAM protein [Ktedonobacteraceae bacterium]|nr:radical SAM protein [Ktedonobacteraceae bacterium]
MVAPTVEGLSNQTTFIPYQKSTWSYSFPGFNMLNISQNASLEFYAPPIDYRTQVRYTISMLVQTLPDTLTKLALMGDATEYEPAGDQPQAEQKRVPYQSHSLAECITNVSTPKGSKPILKTMVTTACERNCNYCPFRAGRSKAKRLTFTPDELAAGLDTLQRAGQVEGMFLSSGIIRGSVTTQDKIIDTAEIVRKRYHYQGYLHLKVMPGIEYDQLYRLMQLADRVSVNLEGPTQERLDALAPKKDFQRELLSMLQLAEQIRRAHPYEKLAGTVTQFVVGAVGDTDHELLSLSNRLYRQYHVTRAYYSGFSPVIQTPFENLPPTNPLREHRLYQASFLLRDYGWKVEDLPFLPDGNMQLDMDPKRAWAERYLREAPVELMTARRDELLRIPGIGPVGADAILKARRQGKLTSLTDLGKLGIRAPQQASPYILLSGRKPLAQLSLF